MSAGEKWFGIFTGRGKRQNIETIMKSDAHDTEDGARKWLDTVTNAHIEFGITPTETKVEKEQ